MTAPCSSVGRTFRRGCPVAVQYMSPCASSAATFSRVMRNLPDGRENCCTRRRLGPFSHRTERSSDRHVSTFSPRSATFFYQLDSKAEANASKSNW